MIDIHTHSTEKSENVKKHFNVIVKLSEHENAESDDLTAYDYLSVGIHPWFIETDRIKEQYELLESYLGLAQVRFLGEIGLDKIKGPDFKIQQEVFIKQIRLAERFKKPVLIHCVRAFNELLGIQKLIKPKVPMIIHGFNKKKEVAQTLLQKGFYLSFGKDLLTQKHVKEAFLATDLDRVFFETDDADLNIKDVYQEASALIGMSNNELEEKIFNNYLELFL